MGQLPQLQPHDDFPCFLSLRNLMTMAAIIPISTSVTMIVPALFVIACIISLHFPSQPGGLLILFDEQHIDHPA